MIDEELKIDIFEEVPAEGMNTKDNITYTHESKQTYPSEKVGTDGLLELDFTVENYYLTDAENNPVRFNIQVSKKTKDPADNKKDIFIFVEDQMMQVLSNIEVIRSQDLKNLGIKAKKEDGAPFTKEEKIALRKKAICFKNTALMVEKSTLTPEAVENCNVFVEVDEMAEIEKEKAIEIIFPLLIKPDNDKGNTWGKNYDWRANQGANQTTFNSWRSHKTRKHAARDLYTPPFTPVVAICDGIVLDTGKFYAGTDYIAVHHKTKDGREFIINYGEVDIKTKKVKKGDEVKQKMILGFTGLLNGVKAISGYQIYMLHFEMYSGSKGFDLSQNHILGHSNIYTRRSDLIDSLDILIEGYNNTFNKGQNIDLKEFTIADAEKALRIIFDKYGKEMAIIIEKMYRLETTHFTSLQYKICGSGGMEAVNGRVAPYYGWDSNFFNEHSEHKFLGIKEIFENPGMSGQGGNAQVKDKPKRFIVLNSVLAGMEYKAYYINKYDGNYARWAGLIESVQENYRQSLVGVKAKIVENF